MTNSKKPKAALVDIDGTLADVEHRRHFVDKTRNGPRDFNSFYKAMIHDTVKEDIRGIVNMLFVNGWHIFITTGRPETYRDITEKWLIENSCFYHTLVMRSVKRAFDPDFLVKKDMLVEIQKTHNPVYAIDDRDQVVKMWREEGLTCFQVAEGNF